MKLVTFLRDNYQSIGVLVSGTTTLIDIQQLKDQFPSSMIDFVSLGDAGLDQLKEAVTDAPNEAVLNLADVELLAPIPVPRKNIMCVGRNYHEHAKEFHDSGFDATAGKTAVPDDPIIFTKAPTSVIGPNASIPSHLDPTNSVDYEGELGVVIGNGGRDILKQDAFQHVYGYTVINDVTARNLQHKHKQWFIGKSLDGFCPMGPTLLTAGEVDDVGSLNLITAVNGEIRQDASVSDLIFDIPTLIETISAGITLEPGDIIATGTPVGVGIGFEPPIFLKPGDIVRVTIEPIGSLENTVV